MLHYRRSLILLLTTAISGCDQPVAKQSPDALPHANHASAASVSIEWDQTIYGLGTTEQPYFITLPPDQQIQFSFEVGPYEEVEYEPDTGKRRCPKTLPGNVSFNIRINAVGDRWFTFYGPHDREAYLGRGVYRYKMSHGFSEDDYWSAEGPWVGYCAMFGRVGIATPTEFEGTISARRTGPPPGTENCSGGGMTDNQLIYDPYDTASSSAGCSGESGGAGENEQSTPTDEQPEPESIEFGCVTYTWDDGSLYMKCTRTS